MKFFTTSHIELFEFTSAVNWPSVEFTFFMKKESSLHSMDNNAFLFFSSLSSECEEKINSLWSLLNMNPPVRVSI